MSAFNHALDSNRREIANIDIGVLGAGAAGLAAAIFAARRLPGCRIAVFDGAKKIGAKILVAGGGRCNVTNERVQAGDFWGGSRNTIKQVLAAFSASAAVTFFRDIGVEMHIEENGKYFPDTNSAKTVLFALLAEAQRRGVIVAADHRVTSVESASEGFRIETSQGEYLARAVVLATGGKSLPKTGSDGAGYALAEHLGHSTVATTPGLAPLVLEGDFHRGLAGVSLPVEMILEVEGEKLIKHGGAMLWTHFGVSGPAALDVSRVWHRARLEGKRVDVSVNFFPSSDAAKVEQKLIESSRSNPRIILENALAMFIPSRLAAALLAELKIEARTVMAHLSRESRRQLGRALTHWPLPVRDSRGYNFAEVTAGGITLSEIDPRTMGSRVCPGLFLVGEILDVDGRIGGFNFQWAWSSGFVAGIGLAQYLQNCA